MLPLVECAALIRVVDSSPRKAPLPGPVPERKVYKWGMVLPSVLEILMDPRLKDNGRRDVFRI